MIKFFITIYFYLLKLFSDSYSLKKEIYENLFSELTNPDIVTIAHHGGVYVVELKIIKQLSQNFSINLDESYLNHIGNKQSNIGITRSFIFYSTKKHKRFELSLINDPLCYLLN